MESGERAEASLINRREAIRRVSALLGGIALVGGSSLLNGCRPGDEPNTDAPFTAEEIAYLDEIADTILPETSTPGAKAARTGAFMAMMVTETYDAGDRRIFRDGLRELDRLSKQDNAGASFMTATPQQRLALLQKIDREQYAHSRARETATRRKAGLPDLPPDARPAQETLPDRPGELDAASNVGAATAITADTPAHYFRMMKELALLGYFTSEIGCTQAQRYTETPGRYDPCVPYQPGEKSWAPHA